MNLYVFKYLYAPINPSTLIQIMAFLCGSSSAALALADSRSKENVLLTSANEQLILAKSQLESEVQRLASEVQRLTNANERLESDKKELEEQLENAKEKANETDQWMCATLLKRDDCIAALEKKIEELELRGPKDEHIAALEKKIEELDHTYSLGWAETSQTNADLAKANADLTKENEEFRHFLDQFSSDEMVERNVVAMEETIESMQAEIYELHYFLGSKGYKARMLHAEGIRIPDEDAHAWWEFSACTRRNEDGSYSFFAHPDEEKTRPANMVNPNYGKQIRQYVSVTKTVNNIRQFERR